MADTGRLIAVIPESLEDCFWPILLKNSFLADLGKIPALIARADLFMLGAYERT